MANSHINTFEGLLAGMPKWKDQKKKAGLNARFLWSGGKRGTPFNWDWVDEEDFIYQLDKKRNKIRQDDYLRLDTGVKYKINKPKVSHEFGVDIQNVTDRLNIGSISYYILDGESYTSYSFLQGILPFFHYRIEF